MATVKRKASGVMVADMPKIMPRTSIETARRLRCFLGGFLVRRLKYGIANRRVVRASGT